MWAYILTPLGFKDQMGLCSTFVGFLIRFCQVINQQRCPACLIHNATFRTNQRRKKKSDCQTNGCAFCPGLWEHGAT